MDNPIIQFLRKKDFKQVRILGRGGLGETRLLKDEIIDEYFVSKKYSPLDGTNKEKYFANFIQEIKLLHLLYHNNVVRVFNYYLYPEKLTGYIIMEYIKGKSIDDYVSENPERINDVFEQLINGFQHLEKNKILHRDIRPQNVLVSDEGNVKIIDFGFGKNVEFKEDYEKSISINWRYSIPDEFRQHIYDYKTEVYFVGKLFDEILSNCSVENFAYKDILRRMTLPYDSRLKSFFDIDREIIHSNSKEDVFSDIEKATYRHFADDLSGAITGVQTDIEYTKDIELIIKALDDVYRSSMLEEYLPNPLFLTRCFIKGTYTYKPKERIRLATIKSFLSFLKISSLEKQRIVMNNLWRRLDSIRRYEPSDDLPF